MDKKQETMSQDAKSDGDVFTGICTVGALAPHLDKVLDVDDIAMVIVIDRKRQRHLRINYPTKMLARDEEDASWEVDSKGCLWKIRCDRSGGDPGTKVRECVGPNPTCSEEHKISYPGPC